MSQRHAAEFFKAVQQAQDLKTKFQAIANPQRFVQLAAEQGYSLKPEEVIQLSAEELAAMLNPGVGGRQRIVPR